MPENTPATPTPTNGHPHPHDAHPHDHECPDHYHRCHATFHGYIDCPAPHEHMPKMKTELLTVACGADDPKPQIAGFLAQPGHGYATVAQVLDLGHDGWLVIFTVPE